MLGLDGNDVLRIVNHGKMGKAHRFSSPMNGGVDSTNAVLCLEGRWSLRS